jgi:hypothetical protein
VHEVSAPEDSSSQHELAAVQSYNKSIVSLLCVPSSRACLKKINIERLKTTFEYLPNLSELVILKTERKEKRKPVRYVQVHTRTSLQRMPNR